MDNYSAQLLSVHLLDLLALLVGSVAQDVDDFLLVGAPTLHCAPQGIGVAQWIERGEWAHCGHFLSIIAVN